MTPERHVRIRAVFLEAARLPEKERTTFLVGRCGDDPELLGEVQKLLANNLEETLAKPDFRPGVAVSGEPSASTFAAGDIVDGRYRIVSLLGQGGMGSVYRTDDLTLNQPIAIKFLDPRFACRADWVERFRNEVRLARRVTHPNVCRVFDIGETDGQVFLSMEYVDGENVGNLIGRIGRLSLEKATDIARQTCIGLAAAHGAGVLHRDLKPANIMLDGSSRVRLTDFGIAVASDASHGLNLRAGTPAYMAPEQITGRGVDVRSDIYALGLVLYELFGGQPAFQADSFEEYARLQDHEQPRPLSDFVVDMDPSIDALVRRCLAKDPSDRPASALAVAAALPGVDVLSVALAAGQTPAPSLVAGASSAAFRLLHPGRFAAVAIVCCFLIPMLRSTAHLPWESSGSKAPAVLAGKAGEILDAMGRQDQTSTAGYCGQVQVGSLLHHFGVDPAIAQRLSSINEELMYWHRSSPGPLAAGSAESLLFGNARSSLLDPSPLAPGQQIILFDLLGRLRLYLATPSTTRNIGAEPLWSPLLAAAALSSKAESPLSYDSPIPLGAQQCERQPITDLHGNAIEVHACRTGNQVTLFLPVGPAVVAEEPPALFVSRTDWAKAGLRLAFLLVLAVSVPLAWHNCLTGRADVAGALKTGGVVFVVQLTAWLVGTDHSTGFSSELFQFTVALVRALAAAALVVILYFGLEPATRRNWPHLLVGWSRLLAFRRNDSVVWEHMLFGLALGSFWAMIFTVEWGIVNAFGWSSETPFVFGAATDRLLGGGAAVASYLQAASRALAEILLFAAILAFARSILRRPHLAALIVAFALAPLILPRRAQPATSWLMVGIGVIAVGVWSMVHVGLLAVAVAAAVAACLNGAPLRLGSSPWSGQAALLLGTIIAGALYAWNGSRRSTTLRAT